MLFLQQEKHHPELQLEVILSINKREDWRYCLQNVMSEEGHGTSLFITLNHERGSEFLFQQLSKLNFKIFGVSESHWKETCGFTESDYRVFNSGKMDTHGQGVTLILNGSAQRAQHSWDTILCHQGRSQPHSPGWARILLSSVFPQISINFSSNLTYFLPHFCPLGGRVAHPGRPWLRHCVSPRLITTRF